MPPGLRTSGGGQRRRQVLMWTAHKARFISPAQVARLQDFKQANALHDDATVTALREVLMRAGQVRGTLALAYLPYGASGRGNTSATRHVKPGKTSSPLSVSPPLRRAMSPLAR